MEEQYCDPRAFPLRRFASSPRQRRASIQIWSSSTQRLWIVRVVRFDVKAQTGTVPSTRAVVAVTGTFETASTRRPSRSFFEGSCSTVARFAIEGSIIRTSKFANTNAQCAPAGRLNTEGGTRLPTMLFFNMADGYAEAIVRGFRSAFITEEEYHHLTQCETIDGV